ncbi:MAG: hypothetical protein QOF76_13 [Solirubrobacteraceae bacterium]|jgi:predicted acylesterase/phospholipase RssA/CRP-like cAMP-binding protein|nr:hypothetical protein [Solirubrobacteraceae bacterium]
MMDATAALTRSPLFEGLAPDEIEDIAAQMRPVRFAAGEQLCAAGDPSDRVWLITAGLVSWTAGATTGGGDIVLRMRKGDVIGAQDALTHQDRSVTVVATSESAALELSSDDLNRLARLHPQILVNVIETQRERLFRASARNASLFSANIRSSSDRRGEEVGLVAGPSLAGMIPRLHAAAQTACPRPVTLVDRSLSIAGALTQSDDLAAENATVLIQGDLDPANLATMLDEVDRVVALAGTAAEADQLGRVAKAAAGRRLEVVLVSEDARNASRMWGAGSDELIVRECAVGEGSPLGDTDLSWVARHLTRTKLGLALGAGGAKGFAHIGVLQVLEEAGYTVDYVGGSSIGGFVSSQLALGFGAAEIDMRMRQAFNADRLPDLFPGPFPRGTKSIDTLIELLKEATQGLSFSHCVIPLVVMTLDLTSRVPVAQREGLLWDALVAALSVAGVFPERERDGHRLVDAIALVPVPTPAVLDEGADVVVSVNLLGAATHDAWPGVPMQEPEEPVKPKRRNALDTMLEAMDLGQLDTSTRLADLAQVAITPIFGPHDWRDFLLADRFMEAGRAAALEQLPALTALARPVQLGVL